MQPAAPAMFWPDFPRWMLKGRPLLPIVQGGMGVGISAHRLASAVARLGAMGTISSVDLRHHHPDLLEQTKDCRDQDQLDQLNLVALDLQGSTADGHRSYFSADGRLRKIVYIDSSVFQVVSRNHGLI